MCLRWNWTIKCAGRIRSHCRNRTFHVSRTRLGACVVKLTLWKAKSVLKFVSEGRTDCINRFANMFAMKLNRRVCRTHQMSLRKSHFHASRTRFCTCVVKITLLNAKFVLTSVSEGRIDCMNRFANLFAMKLNHWVCWTHQMSPRESHVSCVSRQVWYMRGSDDALERENRFAICFGGTNRLH
jgi:ABC-type phosphate/phosphonate transport system ATPase subunit